MLSMRIYLAKEEEREPKRDETKQTDDSEDESRKQRSEFESGPVESRWKRGLEEAHVISSREKK